jgi:hypothetical protein
MSTPVWKIYTASGEYIAACKHSEDAAAVVSLHGQGATVRHNHGHVVWREGAEEFSAGDSYDLASNLMLDRISVFHHRQAAARRSAQDAFAQGQA